MDGERNFWKIPNEPAIVEIVNMAATEPYEIEDEIYKKLSDECISKELCCSNHQFQHIAPSIAETNHVEGFKASRSSQKVIGNEYTCEYERPDNILFESVAHVVRIHLTFLSSIYVCGYFSHLAQLMLAKRPNWSKTSVNYW